MTLASEAPQNKHQTLGQKSDAYKKMSVVKLPLMQCWLVILSDFV